MAKKRQFFRDINPGDVSIEGRQSNGITARSDGSVILYSGVKENELENLQNYEGNIPVDGYLGNIIAVLKSNQEIAYPLGNNNEETYIESPQIDPNKIIITTKSNNTSDCTEEFMDSSNVLLNWENDNTRYGWAPYGANGKNFTKIEEAQTYFLDNYWNTNNNNKDLASYGNSNVSNTKLLIKNLPPGLRIVAAQLNYSTGAWWTRILVALGPDFANAKDSNGKQLGIPYKKSVNIFNDQFDFVRDKNTGVKTSEKIYNPTKNPPTGVDTIIWHTDRIQLFIDQYNEIIKYYNTNKAIFLENLYQESLRYYRGITAVKTKNETNPSSESIYKDFYVEYAKKARDLALTYKDCDPTIVLKYPSTIQQTQPQQQVSTSGLPNKEINIPVSAPIYDEEFQFTDSLGLSQNPVQLTDQITNQFTVDLTLTYFNNTPVTKPISGIPFTNVNLLDFKTLPAKISNYSGFKNFISQPGVKDKVESIAKEIGVTANDLYVIFYAESKFDITAVNSIEATGLIQFIPKTAARLGTSGPALAKMTALQQLDFVRKFYLPGKGKFKNVYDLYLYTFFPIALGKPQGWVIESRENSAFEVSNDNPAIVRAAGKKLGEPLTVADFYKYVSNLLK